MHAPKIHVRVALELVARVPEADVLVAPAPVVDALVARGLVASVTAVDGPKVSVMTARVKKARAPIVGVTRV